MKLLILAVAFGLTLAGLYFRDGPGKNEFQKPFEVNIFQTDQPSSPELPSPSQPKKNPIQPPPRLSPKPTATVTPSQSPLASPTPPGFAIELVAITSPIKRGQTAELKIKTQPVATCVIKVTLPSGITSSAKGLSSSQTADGAGLITWQWQTGSNTKPGQATVKIDCLKDALTASLTLQMIITE